MTAAALTRTVSAAGYYRGNHGITMVAVTVSFSS